MPDRSTPLQRAILHTLRRNSSMTADEVFLSLGVARPDVADSAIALAVRAAVARNLELLSAEGWVLQADAGYCLADAGTLVAA